MKTNYTIFSLLLIAGLGFSIANATIPTNTPLGSTQKEGIFYDYFTNISKSTGITNPLITGFSADFNVIHADGNNFIKGYLATLGGNLTDIVTGFDASGNITKTTVSTVTKKFLSDNAGMGSSGQGIIGFNPTGTPVYSKEIGYWNNAGGILTYNGGVQIGSIIPSGLNVVGNITVSNTPSASNDLITKGFADAYMKDICVRFLGSWNDVTASCSAGTIPGPSCIPHACNAANPACGTTTTGTSDSCGTVCTKTGPVCAGPNSCAATPACNGVSCTTNTGAPTSIGQAWSKGAPNCGFSCTNGYTGDNCEIPPPPAGYTVPGSCGEQNVWGGSLNCMAGEPTYTDCTSTERAFYQASDTTKSCNPMNSYSFTGKKGKCVADSSCSAPSCALEWRKITPSGCLPNSVPYIGDGMVGYEAYIGQSCATPNEIISAGAGDYYGFCPVGTRGIMTMKCSLDASCSSNSCAATPTCNGVSCTTTVGSPTSVNQTWTKGAANCGFTCTGGYTGANCEIPPAAGNCMSYIEDWSNSGQGGNCSATIPAGYTVGDNQPWGTSPTVTLTNTTPGYSGSVTFRCIDSDPPVGTTAAEWVYVSGTCNPVPTGKLGCNVGGGSFNNGVSWANYLWTSGSASYGSIWNASGYPSDQSSSPSQCGVTAFPNTITEGGFLDISDPTGPYTGSFRLNCSGSTPTTYGTVTVSNVTCSNSASPYVFQVASGISSGSCGLYHGNNYPVAGQTCIRKYPGHLCDDGNGVIWKCELPTATPTCNDGIKNGSETGKDCGGSCGSCTWSCPGAPPYGACYDSAEKPFASCSNFGDTVTIYGNGSYCSGSMGIPITGSWGCTCKQNTPPTCTPDGSCSAATPACGTTTNGVDNCGNSCTKTGDPCASVSINGTCGYLNATQSWLCATGTAGQLYDFWGNPVYGYVSGGGGEYNWTCNGEGYGTSESCSGTAYWGMGS